MRWLLAALALAFAALGVWQLERRAWKHALIARVEHRAAAAAASPPFGANPGAWEYRRVRLSGRWLCGTERVQAVTELGPGWWAMSAMSTAGGIVYVNRGFVPKDVPVPTPSGCAVPRRAGDDGAGATVTITGLLRRAEPGGAFLRANDPAAGRWYSRDPAALAARSGLPRPAAWFVDADRIGDRWPRGGLTILRFRDPHLAYALTWFALAALALVGWRVAGAHGRGATISPG